MNPGTVYLLHFDRPYRHARHYTGWAADLAARLALHEQGHGARLLAVAHAAGIGWTLARTWPGGRTRERQIKNQGGASRYCTGSAPARLAIPAHSRQARARIRNPNRSRNRKEPAMSARTRAMLSVDELCGELQISRSTFYDWRQKGRAPRCVRLPNGALRVRRADLDTWLSTCEDAAR